MSNVEVKKYYHVFGYRIISKTELLKTADFIYMVLDRHFEENDYVIGIKCSIGENSSAFCFDNIEEIYTSLSPSVKFESFELYFLVRKDKYAESCELGLFLIQSKRENDLKITVSSKNPVLAETVGLEVQDILQNRERSALPEPVKVSARIDLSGETISQMEDMEKKTRKHDFKMVLIGGGFTLLGVILTLLYQALSVD